MIQKGKLKIYFGYCPGVGKTYQMLKDAKKELAKGVDIIIGYLEPHDRKDTVDMAKGLEVLDIKVINYNNIILHEFDLDKAIQRKAQIILVDELAHSNSITSRNKKRYLDVLELLNEGISVWTTVNVQHLEGLRDMLGDRLAIDVKERVPDNIFDLADEVRIVDLEPEVLIERLTSGKIYNLNKVSLALENYFKKEKLCELRELSLRRNADRLEKTNQYSKLEPKILVLISPSPSSSKNIRVAYRLSRSLHTTFTALYVEKKETLSIESADNIKRHMKLATNLGGNMIVKYGDDLVSIVESYVKVASITDIIIGKTWSSIGKKIGLEEKIISVLPDINVLIIPDNNHINIKSHRFGFLNIFKNRKKYNYLLNKTLDIHNILEKEALINNDISLKIVETLANAFERSVALFNDNDLIYSYKEEDTSFWSNDKERYIINWVKLNKLDAGRGTDTLRDASAFYKYLECKSGIYVLSISCLNIPFYVSDRLILNQTIDLIKLIL